jgi:His/Glu/Gln/Arg/opine family amino acid ABC transporter permease subunit
MLRSTPPKGFDLASALLAALTFLCLFGAAPARAQPPPELRWGGDPEGGAPYVEADPNDPSRVVGFDVEVAGLIAHGLGRTPRFVFVSFASIDQSVSRGDFEVGLSGVEDTPARRAALATTLPYYEFREVLTVRAADRSRFRTLADLKGRKVATLVATMAYEILLDPGRGHGVIPVSYDDDVHPYGDLLLGRVDAVLLDNVIAGREERRRKGLFTQPDAVEVGHYVGVLARSSTALRDRIDQVLLGAMRDGRLEAIFRKWGLWNEDQPALYARLIAAARVGARPAQAQTAGGHGLPGAPMHSTSSEGWLAATRSYLPALLRAAVVTIVLSCLSMALAVALGIVVATGRVYGGWIVRAALTAYVELTRGTPVLLQLFVLYYGLASVVRLPAFLAAFLGLGLNYAAYESEIYRGALEAVPDGQLEAARTLGFTESQVLRLVRGPQAFRLALPPMTNDFVALLKDSSLVSVLTVVELTKQTQIFATNLGSWVLPGALCAALYLAMSLPLARVARGLEARWKAPTA